jgi:hypothetical protein
MYDASPRLYFEALLLKLSATIINRHHRQTTHLWEIGCNNCTIRKLSSCKRFQGIGCRLHGIKLDKYLAHSNGLSATASWSGDLEIEYLAVLAALILYILEDFYSITLV